MDFSKLEDFPVSKMAEESLFALSLIPALGNKSIDAASKLNDKSTADEILSVKNSIYRQLVMLEKSATMEVEIN